MFNLVLSLSLSHTGHWKFNMAPHGKELSEDLKKELLLYISGSQPFSPPGRTMVQVQVSRAARMSFTYYSSIQTNQIYNIIYSQNIMISYRLHLFK